jgi:hypothetical protein
MNSLYRVVFVSVTSLLLFAAALSAQTPDLIWVDTFGGTANDIGYAVQQTSDGGYIIAGQTLSFGAGDSDVYLIKTDAAGALMWSQTYGGIGGDEALSVAETTDGGYVLAGRSTISEPDQGSDNVYVIRTDAAGNMLWSKTYGGTGIDQGKSVVETTDHGFAVAGYTRSFGAGSADAYLVKTDDAGNVIWSQTYGGISTDVGEEVQQTADGGYIVVGATASFGSGSLDIYLVKTDAAGDILWSRTYGGAGWDYGYSVEELADGYVVAGETESYGAGDRDVYLIRTDAAGDVVWERTFGGTLKESGWSVQQTSPDGGFFIAGFTTSFGAGSYDVYIVKTGSDGTLEWSDTYGGVYDDRGHAGLQTADGGYIVVGQTESEGAGALDVYVLKLGSAGVTTGSAAGTVAANSTALGGAIVDLYDGSGNLVESTTADLDDGTYGFEAEAGSYAVELVLPLGYVVAEGYSLYVPITIEAGGSVTVDFGLEPIVTEAEARSKGYWTQELQADLAIYQQTIYNHFYARTDGYAIRIDGVTASGDEPLASADALSTLSARGSAGMLAKAHEQFLALLLNVAAGKVGQYHLVTGDGMTVSQAITYVADLLDAGDVSSYELAKDIAEQVNEDHQIAEGTIPATTPSIAYGQTFKPEPELSLNMKPNPAAEMVEISYSVPSPDSRVTLAIYDLSGSLIRKLADNRQARGYHRIIWECDDSRGEPVAPGMYFCRLRIDEDTRTEKVLTLR